MRCYASLRDQTRAEELGSRWAYLWFCASHVRWDISAMCRAPEMKIIDCPLNPAGRMPVFFVGASVLAFASMCICARHNSGRAYVYRPQPKAAKEWLELLLHHSAEVRVESSKD